MRNEYAIYLRKSRADLEAEAHGEGDVLVTHRKTLLALSERCGYSIGAIYEEIVSGDTISDRPQMQKLLEEVKSGRWRGVIVMEIERLARGDSIDQGIVTRAFRISGTLIVTPSKIFDPNNYYDEEHLEFDLFMSRREYRMINRRLQAGRLAAVKDGRWLSGMPPFGYDRQKIEGEKGYMLVPSKDADTVRLIFEMYVQSPELGTTSLCRELTRLGLRMKNGKEYRPERVRQILSNVVYIGMVTWQRTHRVSEITEQGVKKKTKRSKQYEISPGRHEALISRDIWDKAQAKLKEYAPRVPAAKGQTNPLAGILRCGCCGYAMVLVPHGKYRNYQCGHRCGIPVSTFAEVEDALIFALKKWLKEYKVEVKKLPGESSAKSRKLEEALGHCNVEMQSIEAQRVKAFELIETGVYTVEQFQERQRILSMRRNEALEKIEALRADLDAISRMSEAKKEIVPQVSTVLKAYDRAKSVQEKNALLKSILSKVIYTKTTTKKSPEGSDLTLTLYPRLPNK